MPLTIYILVLLLSLTIKVDNKAKESQTESRPINTTDYSQEELIRISQHIHQIYFDLSYMHSLRLVPQQWNVAALGSAQKYIELAIKESKALYGSILHEFIATCFHLLGKIYFKQH